MSRFIKLLGRIVDADDRRIMADGIVILCCTAVTVDTLATTLGFAVRLFKLAAG